MYRLCSKLKALKEPLRKLNNKHFSHISERAKIAEETLLSIQQQLHDNPTDCSLQSEMAAMKIKASNLAEAERSFCSQLAKARFLQNSDRGTKFFHDLIKSSRSQNHIASISLTDGSRSKLENQVRLLCIFIKIYWALIFPVLD